jgi:hypothetical protein
VAEQPTEEWDKVDAQTQQEIRERLHHVIEDAERAAYRGRLTRYSRPSQRVMDALRHTV